VIAADGEFQASERLRRPPRSWPAAATVQLRYLQTLTEVAAENNSTIVFPIPIDLIEMFLDRNEPEPAS
jgi:hypothetical protein